jgi:molybdopterin-binding protein
LGEYLQTLAHSMRGQHRLVLGLVGACVVHAVGFWLLHAGIWWKAVSADQHRVLTLSLRVGESDSTAYSNALEHHTQSPLRQAEAANASSFSRLGDSSLARQRESREPREPSSVDAVVASQVDPPQPLEPPVHSPPPVTVSKARSLDALQSSVSNLGENWIAQVGHTEAELTIRTVTNRNPQSTVSEDSSRTERAEIVQVTESEQRMLTERLRDWAESVPTIIEQGGVYTWEDDGQAYEAQFSKRPAKGDMDLEHVTVTLSTTKNGKSLQSSMQLKKMAFSNFGQFVHRWDPKVSMHDDTVSGRFHSNSRFNLDYSRRLGIVFADKVTTAARKVNFSGPASPSQVFQGGLETAVQKITMPQPRLLFDQAKSAATDTAITHTIEQDTSLIFKAGGYVELVPDDPRSGSSTTLSLSEQPTYFIAAPRVVLSVQGVVNGSIAVYSPARIEIAGSITYQSSGALENGGDFLGLISAGNIVVLSRKITGPGDLEIHGALYARNRFLVTQTRGRRAGTLRILGSVSAGSVSVTEPRYATRIDFDRRLETVRPPGFPVTNRYELLARERGWQVVPDVQTESILEAQSP